MQFLSVPQTQEGTTVLKSSWSGRQEEGTFPQSSLSWRLKDKP